MKRLILTSIILSILLAAGASAEFWACFGHREVINYCNDYKPAETCGEPNGCTKCMSIYDSAENCFVHGVWPTCIRLPPGECSISGGTTIDQDPPEITISNIETGETISPLDEYPFSDTWLFNKRMVRLNIQVDERSSIYMLDNIYGRGRTVRLCTDCFGYDRARSFREGLNDITIIATDRAGNTAELDFQFIVDSRAPRLYRPEPRRGYANGVFSVDYDELNPARLEVKWRGEGMTIHSAPIYSYQCVPQRRTTMTCETSVNLLPWDGQEIIYWFEMEDIVGNIAKTRPTTLQVDLTPPVITSFDPDINGRYVTFTMAIEEDNFYRVEYIDESVSRPRWRTLCTRLTDGSCVRRLAFRYGDYDLNFRVLDAAGNQAGAELSFTI